MEDKKIPKVLQNEVQYQELFFYQKAEVLYALTYHFAKRFLTGKTDRTVDQMIQAARSGKQNIVEGFADGMTSTELQLKLLNVARASLKELRADYEDYAQTRHLPLWPPSHPRYDEMLHFCRYHNRVSDYEPFFNKWSDEEQCNLALTLLHMTDKMMKTYLGGLDRQFVTQGGIKERMYAARTGYRQGVDEELLRLRDENKALRQQVPVLEQRIEQLLSEKLQPSAQVLKDAMQHLAELDILLAKALQFKKLSLALPEIGSTCRIRGMFHPEVRDILRRGGRDFQCIDFDFEPGVPSTVIGANMGGKTVALKTLCLLQYLFQFGFALPVASAVMVPFDEVRFCIGDGQSETKGLSSFAAEIRRIDAMICAVGSGKKVLALVDEPARTTNPVEGTALVQALLERIGPCPGLALVLTTHYTVAHDGRCWKVAGLIPGSKGLDMDYRLERTASHEVPHEALGIARELGADAGWIDLADTIMKRKYE